MDSDVDMTVTLVSSRWAPDGPVEVAACTADAVVPDPAANPVLVDDCETLLGIRDVLDETGELNWTADHPITWWDGAGLDGAPPPCPFDKLTVHGRARPSMDSRQALAGPAAVRFLGFASE